MKINKTRTALPWAPKKKHVPFQREEQKVAGDQAFYNTADWRKLSEVCKMENPMCEPCKMADRLKLSDLTDHIIRWQEGGAKYDRRNCMRMCKTCHNRKSGMEKHRPILIATIEVDGELIPKDRNDIFKILNG